MSLYLDVSPLAEARLAAAAHQRGIDIAALIEMLAVDYLPSVEIASEPRKTAGEIIREIGFADGGPSDLSTNPKYMKGFGETGNRRDLTP